MGRDMGGRWCAARTGCVAAAVLLLLGPGCAGIAEQLRERIDEREYAEAIETAREWLRDPENRDDRARPQVRRLLAEASFRSAQQVDSYPAYLAFRNEFRDSEWADEALELESQAFFRDVTRPRDRIDAYQEFQRRYPASSLVREAWEREAELAWEEAHRTDSWRGYVEFRESYPDSRFENEALALETDRHWEIVESRNLADEYRYHRERYPESRWFAEALRREEEIVWEETTRENTRQRYRAFRTRFPDSSRARTAWEREERLMWEEAERIATAAKFWEYVRLFPDSPRVLEAEERAMDLEWLERPQGSDELTASVTQINDRNPEVVRLYVDVRDRRGGSVGGLGVQDFTVFERRRRAEIVGFASNEAERPIDIVMLIDISGSMADEIDSVKRSAIYFASLLGFSSREYRFGLITFLNDVERIFGGQGLTQSPETFQQWVGSVPPATGWADENPIQAIWRATQLRFRPEAQKVVILFTDEPPRARDSRSGLDIDGAARLIVDRDVTLIAIVRDDTAFRRLVENTSGLFFDIDFVNQQIGFDRMMGILAHLLGKQYRIEYRSPGGLSTGASRDIRVRALRGRAWVGFGELGQHDLVGFWVEPTVGAACPRILAATRDAWLWCSTDCGSTWTQCGGVDPGSPPIALVAGKSGNANVLYVLLQDGRMAVSGDSGQFWTVRDGPPGGAAFVTVHPVNATWILCGGPGGLYLSKDGAASFEAVHFTEAGATAAAHWASFGPSLAPRICIVSSAGLVCSGDGEGWEVREAAGLPGDVWGTGTRLWWTPWSGDLMFLIAGHRLYRSLDRGASWHEIVLFATGIETTPGGAGTASNIAEMIGDLVFVPGATPLVCVATTRGVFCSDDRGRTFRAIGGRELTAGVIPLLWSVGTGEMFAMGGPTGKVYRQFLVSNREIGSEKVCFATGSDRPKPEFLNILDDIASTLIADRSLFVLIEGHTDDRGSEEDNLDLSWRRARNVQQHLLSRGVREDQTYPRGYGETTPLVSGTSDAARARNRRVELLFLSRPLPPPAATPAPSGGPGAADGGRSPGAPAPEPAAAAPVSPAGSDTCQAAPLQAGGFRTSGETTRSRNDWGNHTPCTGYAWSGADHFWAVRLQAGQRMTVRATAADWDHGIYVFTDCAQPASSCVAGADVSNESPAVSYTAPREGIYYIGLDGYEGDGGPYDLSVDVTPSPVPAPLPPAPGRPCDETNPNYPYC